jgi:xanthine dehydrogenase small subunit
MISFILNDKLIRTSKPAGMTVLDFIRYKENLKGTKIGCREGDCGACTVIQGQLEGQTIVYGTIVSCLTPLGNVHGKHIVTIEGLNKEPLTPVQQALVDHNGAQCGFCTPGFVVSLTAFLLIDNGTAFDSAIAAIDGNICRCTGYKSIERAAAELVSIKKKIPQSGSISWLVSNDYLPEYFLSIESRLKKIEKIPYQKKNLKTIIGGGTDLFVQKPDELYDEELVFNFQEKQIVKITQKGNKCIISGSATATDLMESAILQKHIPNLKKYFKLISSTPIRNMGSLAGNIVNASPIGDLSIFFLALHADLTIVNKGSQKRKIKLKDFFLDYKKFDLQKNELVKTIEFKLPGYTDRFNFEKVSKRTFLDIASVNTAIRCKVKHNKIIEVHLSAGGVSPVPLYLEKTADFLMDMEINAETVVKANRIAQEEIAPISDIRGTADYKRLLLRQLIFAHFIELFPEKIAMTELIQQVET